MALAALGAIRQAHTHAGAHVHTIRCGPPPQGALLFAQDEALASAKPKPRAEMVVDARSLRLLDSRSEMQATLCVMRARAFAVLCTSGTNYVRK
jgi:hypothetical protein